MSTITAESTAKIELTVTLVLTEIEAKALNAMTVYGVDAFLKGYYKQLGRNYTEPYEQGFRSLFESIKSQLPHHINRVDNMRKVFNELDRN